MGVEMMIKMVVAMLGEYLLKPGSAAKYAKWFLRGRDYLLLLFPLETYPTDYKGTSVENAPKGSTAVPVEAVKAAMKEKGFNIPFVKGK